MGDFLTGNRFAGVCVTGERLIGDLLVTGFRLTGDLVTGACFVIGVRPENLLFEGENFF
jgi:hypothetical protein